MMWGPSSIRLVRSSWLVSSLSSQIKVVRHLNALAADLDMSYLETSHYFLGSRVTRDFASDRSQLSFLYIYLISY